MPAPNHETVGFIDIGTNSVHLSVVRYYPETTGASVFQDKEMIRLGKGLYSEGSIGKDTIRNAALIVSRFARISRSMGADEIVAVATCAAREAPDGGELLRALSPYADVRVIPGPEEARLIALGVFGPEGPAERSIVIDIGGGSTEVAIRENGKDLFLDSLSLGSVRFAYGLGIDFSERLSDEDYNVALREVDTNSYHAVGMVREAGFKKAYGSSGTMMALAAMCAARRGDGDASYMTLEELRDLMRMLRGLGSEERSEVKGLSRNRADIIIAGGAIADELMFLMGVDRIEISPYGIREGLQLDLVLSKGRTVFGARETSVRSLAFRCGCDRRHAETVERYSMLLFDEARGMRLHTMSEDMRSLLSCAAFLHDIGEVVNYENHNVLSQMMIENSDMVGFDMTELHCIGLMVRFHHKKFPGPKDRTLRGLPLRTASDVRRCAMFLRMADILDRHRTSSVEGLEMSMEDGAATLRFDCREDPTMEVWRLEKIKDDFEKLFGRRLRIVPSVKGPESSEAAADPSK